MDLQCFYLTLLTTEEGRDTQDILEYVPRLISKNMKYELTKGMTEEEVRT